MVLRSIRHGRPREVPLNRVLVFCTSVIEHGAVSRLDWAKAILKYDPDPDKQVVKEILPALSSEFPTPAERPLYSPVNCDLFADTFDLRLPDWDSAQRMMMDVR